MQLILNVLYQRISIFCVFVSALSLDPEQKDQLIEVIEKLLADKTTVRVFVFCTIYTNILPIFFPTDFMQEIQLLTTLILHKSLTPCLKGNNFNSHIMVFKANYRFIQICCSAEYI